VLHPVSSQVLSQALTLAYLPVRFLVWIRAPHRVPSVDPSASPSSVPSLNPSGAPSALPNVQDQASGPVFHQVRRFSTVLVSIEFLRIEIL
jgi:hypothetical protein